MAHNSVKKYMLAAERFKIEVNAAHNDNGTVSVKTMFQQMREAIIQDKENIMKDYLNS